MRKFRSVFFICFFFVAQQRPFDRSARVRKRWTTSGTWRAQSWTTTKSCDFFLRLNRNAFCRPLNGLLNWIFFYARISVIKQSSEQCSFVDLLLPPRWVKVAFLWERGIFETGFLGLRVGGNKGCGSGIVVRQMEIELGITLTWEELIYWKIQLISH